MVAVNKEEAEKDDSSREERPRERLFMIPILVSYNLK